MPVQARLEYHCVDTRQPVILMFGTRKGLSQMARTNLLQGSPSDRVISDVLHGHIRFSREDDKILASPEVQRLRYIRQNDVAFLVYPSMNTSRLEHSLGVMHVARLIARAALENSGSSLTARFLKRFKDSYKTDNPRETFIAAAARYGLLHDVGHLPFSHQTEDVLNDIGYWPYKHEFKKLHEAAGAFLTSNSTPLGKVLADDATGRAVADVMKSKSVNDPCLQALKDIVDSDVDADRIDSTARDGLMSGSEFGHFDISRIIESATLYQENDTANYRVLFTTRALSAIESLLMERFNTYRWIHHHHKVVALKHAFSLCFQDAIHRNLLKRTMFDAKHYVTAQEILDDAVVVSAFRRLEDSPFKDELLSRRKASRSLWKRRDEFLHVCHLVADGQSQLEESNKNSPILNRLEAKDVQEFQNSLNEASLKEDLLFCVSWIGISPYTTVRFDQQVGTMELLDHQEQTQRILLTKMSPLIRALRGVASREPRIGVTVFGADDGARRERGCEIFVATARRLIPTLKSRESESS